MHKHIFRLLGIIFLCIGLFIASIGVIVFAFIGTRSNRIRTDRDPVTAVIVDITRHHTGSGNINNRVYIEYEVSGITITAPLRWWSSSMFVGQPVQIFVSQDNPRDFVSDSPVGTWVALPIFLPGFIFIVLGASFLMYESRRKKRRQWLLEYGTPVWADVQGTEDNWSVHINGRPATVLVATRGHKRFVSGPLNNNDLSHVGERVKIMLDPDNYDRYEFDIYNESSRQPDESFSRF